MRPDPLTAPGWVCPACETFKALGDPDLTWVGLPLTEQDIAWGRYRKVGLKCPTCGQVGQWEAAYRGATNAPPD